MTGGPSEQLRAEAAARTHAAAFTIGQSYEDAGQQIVHCFAGMFGADWSLQSALDAINTAVHIQWADGFVGHDLLVVTPEGRTLKFDVDRPEETSPDRLTSPDTSRQ